MIQQQLLRCMLVNMGTHLVHQVLNGTVIIIIILWELICMLNTCTLPMALLHGLRTPNLPVPLPQLLQMLLCRNRPPKLLPKRHPLPVPPLMVKRKETMILQDQRKGKCSFVCVCVCVCVFGQLFCLSY
jgi:hypothetical protein